MTTATAVQTLQEIPLDQLEPSPYQTRRFTAGAQDLEELAESIRQFGVLEPVLVRPGTGEVPYQLLAGERRLRAARLAGLDAVPAIVRELDDDAALEVGRRGEEGEAEAEEEAREGGGGRWVEYTDGL